MTANDILTAQAEKRNPHIDRDSLLEANGWTVECSSPLEISHFEGSFATGLAAITVIASLREENRTEESLLEYLMENAYPKNHPMNNRLYLLGIADLLHDELGEVRQLNPECFEAIAKLAQLRYEKTKRLTG